MVAAGSKVDNSEEVQLDNKKSIQSSVRELTADLARWANDNHVTIKMVVDDGSGKPLVGYIGYPVAWDVSYAGETRCNVQIDGKQITDAIVGGAARVHRGKQ